MCTWENVNLGVCEIQMWKVDEYLYLPPAGKSHG